MKEVWKPVPSLPGYVASSWGRIKLPEKTTTTPMGGLRTYKTKPRYGDVMSAKKGARHKYRSLKTKDHGHIKVHRVICEAFHGPPPSKKSVVIHLDENALNNRPENLKWGTQKENLNMPGFIKYCKSRTGENSTSAKAKQKRRRSQ